MTTNAPRLALTSILALLAVADVANAQRGRGGMVGHPGGGFARPSMPHNFARPSVPQNFNRPANVNHNFNRPANINQNFGRPANINQNFNRQNNINQSNVLNNRRNVVNNNVAVNNVNNARVNNVSPNYANRGGYGGYGYGHGGYGYGNRGWGPGGYGAGYHANSYYGYHSNWVNGAWGGNFYPGWGGYPGSYGNNFGYNALGLGLGAGIAAWGLGSLINNWGYSSYSNPYYSSLAAQQPATFASQPGAYDYSRPLDLATPPPGEEVIQAAGSSLDTAREAFHAGDYVRALALADQSLVQTPNDPMLHEFRAICLFAQGRYDEAAVPFYTVLSAGPGWDWTTLVGLYPDVDTYTAQLRALEAYCNATPQAASARFVLAALYLTQGSTDAAANRLRQVVAIQPQDKLSAQLLEAITSQAQPAAAQAASPSQPPQIREAVPADPTPVQAASTAPEGPPLPSGPVPANFLGLWTASPSQDVQIQLAIGDEKSFAWKVVQKGQTREFKGDAGFDKDVLALIPPEMPPMVAKVTWKDPTHFNFKAVGTPGDDPGLNFAK